MSAVQAVPELVDMAMQTNWKYPKNAAVQCQPREFTEEEKLAIQQSFELAQFINNVAQRFVFKSSALRTVMKCGRLSWLSWILGELYLLTLLTLSSTTDQFLLNDYVAAFMDITVPVCYIGRGTGTDEESCYDWFMSNLPTKFDCCGM